MTKIKILSFESEDYTEETKLCRQQIKDGTLTVIKHGRTTSVIHTDTFVQMEKYLWGCGMVLKKTDKVNAGAQKFNITGDLQTGISFFVREVYLQPVYYSDAMKKYDTLQDKDFIFQMWKYLDSKTRRAQNRYNELIQKEYRKLRQLLSVADKEAIKTIRNIFLFTENLLSEIPYYFYSSPMMVAFIKAMFDLKKLYDFVLPNDGLPGMNKYFNNIYVSQFEVKFIQFGKDLSDNQPKWNIKKFTYKWAGKPDELNELHDLLIGKYKLIAPETTSEQLKAIFTEQPVENITPVKWHDDNASELLYFIDNLERKDIIEHSKRADYRKMVTCFVKPDGQAFKASFKELKTNLNINLSPDKQKLIKELVENFL